MNSANDNKSPLEPKGTRIDGIGYVAEPLAWIGPKGSVVGLFGKQKTPVPLRYSRRRELNFGANECQTIVLNAAS